MFAHWRVARRVWVTKITRFTNTRKLVWIELVYTPKYNLENNYQYGVASGISRGLLPKEKLRKFWNRVTTPKTNPLTCKLETWPEKKPLKNLQRTQGTTPGFCTPSDTLVFEGLARLTLLKVRLVWRNKWRFNQQTLGFNSQIITGFTKWNLPGAAPQVWKCTRPTH
jgi:hypothetical protein